MTKNILLIAIQLLFASWIKIQTQMNNTTMAENTGSCHCQNVHFAAMVGIAWKPFATKLHDSSSSLPKLRLIFSQPLIFLRFTQS